MSQDPQQPQATTEAELDSYLQSVLNSPSGHLRRTQMVDRLWNDFQSQAEKDSVLKYSEFAKFEILFDSSMREKLLKGELSQDQIQQINALSQELYASVHPQRPIHIVDDATGKEICPPLPPLMMRVNLIHDNHGEIMDQLYTLVSTDDGNPNGMNQARQNAALNQLAHSIIQRLDQKDIVDQINASREMMQRFDHEVLHPQAQEEPQGPTLDPSAYQPAKEETYVDMSMMQFKPLPDDEE